MKPMSFRKQTLWDDIQSKWFLLPAFLKFLCSPWASSSGFIVVGQADGLLRVKLSYRVLTTPFAGKKSMSGYLLWKLQHRGFQSPKSPSPEATRFPGSELFTLVQRLGQLFSLRLGQSENQASGDDGGNGEDDGRQRSVHRNLKSNIFYDWYVESLSSTDDKTALLKPNLRFLQKTELISNVFLTNLFHEQKLKFVHLWL